MQQMNKKIKRYTLVFSLFCSIACAMIFHSQMIQVFIAVWIGCLKVQVPLFPLLYQRTERAELEEIRDLLKEKK